VARLIERMVAFADRVSAWGARVLEGRAVRLIWLGLGSIVAVLGLGFGTLEAASVVAHEEHTEVVEVDAAGRASVAVDNDAGSVTIIGVNGAESVTVRARISEGLRATGHLVDQTDGVLSIRGTCPLFGSDWCSVDYTIEIPPEMYVDARAVDGLSVTDQRGGLAAHSSQSSVELVRVGGDVTVSANQGRIEGDSLTATRLSASADQGRFIADFTTSPDHISVDADQGQVDIVLPDDPEVEYATDAQANQGTVTTDIRTNSQSERTITVQADQGSITIGYGAG
jgi:Putative adhesin